MEVRDNKRGNLFVMIHQPNDVYEFLENDVAEQTSIIQRVAFRMDGVWHTDKRAGQEKCNPYCQCDRVVMSFVMA